MNVLQAKLAERTRVYIRFIIFSKKQWYAILLSFKMKMCDFLFTKTSHSGWIFNLFVPSDVKLLNIPFWGNFPLFGESEVGNRILFDGVLKTVELILSIERRQLNWTTYHRFSCEIVQMRLNLITQFNFFSNSLNLVPGGIKMIKKQ